MLNWRPRYRHACIKQPPKTTLTLETAAEVYQKLKGFLAIQERAECPAAGWPDRGKDFHRHLFQPNGFHHPVRWYPTCPTGWRRMTYQEFCNWYGVKEDQ